MVPEGCIALGLLKYWVGLMSLWAQKGEAVKVLGIGSMKQAEEDEEELVVLEEADEVSILEIVEVKVKIEMLAGKGANALQTHLHQLHRWAPQLALMAAEAEAEEAEEEQARRNLEVERMRAH